MKSVATIVMMMLSSVSMAGGFSNTAVPTGIDVVSAGTSGFMIYGNFGNAAGCTVSNSIFVKTSHPQYQALYAMALSAFNTGQKLIAYAGGCEPLPWYSVSSVTYNVLLDGQSLYVRN